MLDDFRLRIFKTLAEEGSFTKAAARLDISQPAVSQNIAELEKILCRTLFERQRGSVSLTREGEVFMKYAESILASYSEAEMAFARISPSVVKISASEELYNYILEPVLQDFMSVHPQVVFERCLADAPDLKINMQPASRRPFDVPADALIRMKWSLSSPPRITENNMGDFSATHEKSLYFDLLFQPSPAFGCTVLCRLLKEYLTRL